MATKNTGCSRDPLGELVVELRRATSAHASRLESADGGVGGLAGVVAGAGERAGLDVADAHGLAGDLQLGELVGRPPAGHRQVVRGGPQVLADGDDVDADAAQVGERLRPPRRRSRPCPTMSDDLVVSPAALARASTASDRA